MLRSLNTIKNGIERVMDTNDVLANNMANINTVGFKQSKILFKDIQEVEINKLQNKSDEYDPTSSSSSQVAGTLSLGPAVSKMMIDFSQGDFITTGNKLDFAINGKGFFAVEGANNEEVYTRKGNFVIDQNGFLSTTDGQKVLNRDGGQIHFDMENKNPENIVVQQDGLINYGKEIKGYLKIVDFQNKEGLTPTEGAAFNSNGAASETIIKPNIMQGSLEGSNANAIGTMLKSIEASRSYESMTSAMQTTSDTLQKVVNTTGRF